MGGILMEILLSLLTDITDKLETQTHAAIVALGDPLLALAAVLGILSFSTTFEAYFSQTFMAANFIIKIIKVGMYMFFIRHWDSMLVMVKSSAEWLGKIAGGADSFNSPITMIAKGVQAIFDTYGSMVENTPSFMSSNAAGSFLSLILCAVALGIALYGLFKIAFILFMANAEFLILGTLSMVLLPCALLRYTESIAEKTWGILLTCGVKVMVAVFMVCLVGNEISAMFEKLTHSGTVDATTTSQFLLAAVSLVFLSYLMGQSVDFAAAMTTGISLNSGNILRSMGSAAMTAVRTPGRIYRGGRTVYRGGRLTTRVGGAAAAGVGTYAAGGNMSAAYQASKYWWNKTR